MHEKREVCSYIPYRVTGGVTYFYLQKRDADAPKAANMFGMFGGGLEGSETPEESLIREVHEELAYVPQSPKYYSRFENPSNIFHVFTEEVDSDFETRVTVQEGEYGKFLSITEIEELPNVSASTRYIVSQIISPGDK